MIRRWTRPVTTPERATKKNAPSIQRPLCRTRPITVDWSKLLMWVETIEISATPRRTSIAG